MERVRALRAFLEAIGRENIFKNEPAGHDSIAVLMRNLARQLGLIEGCLSYEISLYGAREHFASLKITVDTALEQYLQYLFYAIAKESRSTLSLSLLSAPADTVDKKLHKSLQTREGVLLKNLIQHPQLVTALFPQNNIQAKGFGGILSLVGEGIAEPFVDEEGQASQLWLDFLQKTPELEVQLNPGLRKLPSGLCTLASPGVLVSFIRLHGCMLTLAQFQDYLQQCWKLAGFGGDQLVYDRLAQAISTLLNEFRIFNKALQEELRSFQGQLDDMDTRALNAASCAAWQDNYKHARAHQEELLKILASLDTTLGEIISHAENTSARCRRFEAALKTCQSLYGARDFLSQTRRQMGLPEKEFYLGLENGTQMPQDRVNPDRINNIENALLILLARTPDKLAILGKLCRQTPKSPPYFWQRGSYRRYCYLQNPKRLLKIAENLSCLQYYPERAASKEGKALINTLRTQIQEELMRMQRLSTGLTWPFHRSSLSFFDQWQEVFTEHLVELDRIDSIHPEEPERMSTAETLRHLIAEPEEGDSDSIDDERPRETTQSVRPPISTGHAELKYGQDALARAEQRAEEMRMLSLSL